jgi:hypothetical protein
MTEELRQLLAVREELKALLEKCIGQLEAQKSDANKKHIDSVVDTARTITNTLEVLCNSLLLLQQGDRKVN